MNTTKKTDQTGAEPQDVKKHDAASAEKVDQRIKKDDVTGQTNTTVKEMTTRLKETPHKSAATKHDSDQYDKSKKE